jgi:hypothetical protein
MAKIAACKPVARMGVERCRNVGSSVLLLLVAGVSFGDDSYLRQLDAEVTKIDAPRHDADRRDAAALAAPAGRDAAASVSREAFEVLLREKHVGTYSFYRRLPERSREEIFLDYSNGASMAVLRDKVVDRFLHP